MWPDPVQRFSFGLSWTHLVVQGAQYILASMQSITRGL
ncbi:Unknown protein sequence [Pseudomonas syringae pv. maculicola]|nr:Unknown protein sequence [Pseudomonas syringae pv. maculicola]